MDIDPRIGLGSVGPGSQATQTAGDPNLGKDEFVQLLMAQLSNQDPTQPQDSHEFVAQLAQFANVELAQQQSAQLEALLVAQAANNQTATTQLVGKEVLYMADQITVSSGSTPEIVLDLEGHAQNVRVTLTDEAGNVYQQEPMSNVSGGRTTFTPLDRDGQPLPPGTYKIKVEADDGKGNGVNVVTAIRAHVDGVTFTEGYPQLLVGGIKLNLADVIEVLDNNSTGTTSVAMDPSPPPPEEAPADKVNPATLLPLSYQTRGYR
jgi:flagellar basal-body rod modification protein FlgD